MHNRKAMKSAKKAAKPAKEAPLSKAASENELGEEALREAAGGRKAGGDPLPFLP